MPVLTTANDTEFTPTQPYFIARAVGGSAVLLRKNAAADTLFGRAGNIESGSAPVIWNPTPGAVYKFSAQDGANVRADE